MLTFHQISDVFGNTTCEENFQKIKNARQYYINFTDYLTTSYLNITNNKTYKTLSAVPQPSWLSCYKSNTTAVDEPGGWITMDSI